MKGFTSDPNRRKTLIALACGVLAALCVTLYNASQAAAYNRARAQLAAGATAGHVDTSAGTTDTAGYGDGVQTSDSPATDPIFATLDTGMTAVTLSTDAVHALGGQLAADMRVTLMGALDDGRVADLARDVRVLATDGAGSAVSTVTLAIPDGQVSQILAAANANTVYLVYPGTFDGVEDAQ
ncbi:MAG: hypothetical protein LBS17_03245 [Actinomycetes bacterium]|nr:hypothetical protein [Actinomycetes bacterium]